LGVAHPEWGGAGLPPCPAFVGLENHLDDVEQIAI
jgi:hypothetical protein